MNQHRALGFKASIAALAKGNPGLAFSRVPSSMMSYFGHSLGWPDWLLDGMDLSGQQHIPRDMLLVDGLNVLANLLVHLGEGRVAEIMLQWSRFPTEAEALAAPDLETAMRTLVAKVDERNPTVAITMVEQDDGCAIRISVNSELGPFCAIYEQMTLTWLFLVVRSFLGVSRGGDDLLTRIAIGRVHSDRIVDASLPCQTIDAAGSAMFIIPSEALRCIGPDFKPELWEGVLAALEVSTRPELSRQASVSHAIDELVTRSLRDRGLIPPFVEIARSLGRSERTLARTLRDAGTTYREIVDRIRMNMATDILSQSDASIREISARLGYSDDTAFVRAFQRHFAISPTRWRKSEACSAPQGFGI